METRDMILICKALSDTNRLEIVQMLSDGEKCGCKILDKFDITQPTLSKYILWFFYNFYFTFSYLLFASKQTSSPSLMKTWTSVVKSDRKACQSWQ